MPRPLEVIVTESVRLRGWWQVTEVKPNGTERLWAGPFLSKARAEELAARVNLQRGTRT